MTAETESTSTSVAILLAVAAVVAAVIAGRAALVGDTGADGLNQVVRDDVRQGARIVGDVRRLYEEDASVAFQIALEQILSEETAQVASEETGEVKSVLEADAGSSAGLAEVLSKGSQLADGDPSRTVDLTGDDLLLRLAEIRAERSDDLKALDIDATSADAKKYVNGSAAMIAATIPVAVAFLVGALAGVFRRGRRILLATGYSLITVGLAVALVIEVGL